MTREEKIGRLKYAIERIETKGWCQYSSRPDVSKPDVGPGCMVGSMIADPEWLMLSASYSSSGFRSAVAESVQSHFRQMRRDLAEMFRPRLGMSGISWNDTAARTQAEVLAVLRAELEAAEKPDSHLGAVTE